MTYEALFERWGYTTKAVWIEPDYQGQTIIVFGHKKKWGLLVFSWGSCSGCDALAACGYDNYSDPSSWDEDDQNSQTQVNKNRDKLAASMHDDILWFSSKKNLLEELSSRVKSQEEDWSSDELANVGYPYIIETLLKETESCSS